MVNFLLKVCSIDFNFTCLSKFWCWLQDELNKLQLRADVYIKHNAPLPIWPVSLSMT